jgi:chromosomal replication initiator protein
MPIEENAGLWKKILPEIEKQVGPQTYKTWFLRTAEFSMVGNALTVKAPTKFFADWLERHYKTFVEEIAYNLTAKNIEINFIGSPNNDNVPIGSQEQGKTNIDFISASGEAGLNPKYTFNRFVVGSNNHFAYSAALAVAEKPGKIYNPLFIYGGFGLGKTHIMQAIGNQITQTNPRSKVIYLPTEDFTNEMITAIQTNSTIKFRKKFRNFDILMIDDIHFLAGKEGSQEEFFHTFNTLYNAKKQIVLASDRPPKEIQDLQDRLVSRFEWGLIADIKRPNFETRMAILQQRCKEENVTLPTQVIEFIAEHCDDNVRQLEGSLVKILAFCSYSQTPLHQIKTEIVQEILSDLINRKNKVITLDLIQEEVAKAFKIGKNQIKEPTRKKEIAFPRQIAMYLSAKLIPNTSLLEIANHYNKKDHTTIIHAKKIVSNKIKQNENLKTKIDEIIKIIQDEK